MYYYADFLCPTSEKDKRAISCKLIINDTLCGSMRRIINCTHSPSPPKKNLLPPPPPPPAIARAHARRGTQGVLFRPVPRPLGHFRLFVLLIVDFNSDSAPISSGLRRSRTGQFRPRTPSRSPARIPVRPRRLRLRLLSRFVPPPPPPAARFSRTSLSAWCYGGMLYVVGVCLCAGVWRRRALQSHTHRGSGGDYSGRWGGETCVG